MKYRFGPATIVHSDHPDNPTWTVRVNGRYEEFPSNLSFEEVCGEVEKLMGLSY